MIYFVESLHRTVAVRLTLWICHMYVCLRLSSSQRKHEGHSDVVKKALPSDCRLECCCMAQRLEKITTEILESGKRLPTYMEKSFDSITIANCGFNFQTLSRSGEPHHSNDSRLSFDLAVRTVLSSASIFNCRVADKLAPQKFIDLLGKFTVHFTDHSLLLWVLWLLCHIQLNWFALGNRSGRIYWSEMNLVIIWISIGIWAWSFRKPMGRNLR